GRGPTWWYGLCVTQPQLPPHWHGLPDWQPHEQPGPHWQPLSMGGDVGSLTLTIGQGVPAM
ncbi:hypothetical protein ACFU99_38500, partial [Streptomyces sp. NPDC057654]|uniref:hypothetical protein n=1 Tax=Streptomyces sp. NPDC057654 TaxID=3346196 RepID=UPI003689EA2F